MVSPDHQKFHGFLCIQYLDIFFKNLNYLFILEMENKVMLKLGMEFKKCHNIGFKISKPASGLILTEPPIYEK